MLIDKNKIKKRSFLRGLSVGLLVYLIATISIVFIYAIITTTMVHDISNLNHAEHKGPMIPGSIDWYISQTIGFLCSIASGSAAARYSKPGSWGSVIGLALLAVSLSLFHIPATHSLVLILLWFLLTPAGMLIGGFLYFRHEK